MAPLPLSPSAMIRQEVQSVPSHSKCKNSICTRAVFRPHNLRLSGRKSAVDLPLDPEHAGWGSAHRPPNQDFNRMFSANPEWEFPQFPFPENPKETESKIAGLVDRTIVQGPFVGPFGPLLLLCLGHTCDQPPLHCCQMQQHSLLRRGFCVTYVCTSS